MDLLLAGRAQQQVWTRPRRQALNHHQQEGETNDTTHNKSTRTSFVDDDDDLDSSEYSYTVRIKVLDPRITPQNRILVCRAQPSYCCGTTTTTTVRDTAIEKAHERLQRAYQKAHLSPKPLANTKQQQKSNPRENESKTKAPNSPTGAIATTKTTTVTTNKNLYNSQERNQGDRNDDDDTTTRPYGQPWLEGFAVGFMVACLLCNSIILITNRYRHHHP